MCRIKPETVEHTVSSYLTILTNEYTDTHNAIAKISHAWLAFKIGHLVQRTPYYIYQPENICEIATNTIHADHYIMK